MIQFFRTSTMEWAANLLVKHYRHVVIRQAFVNRTRIRFRADWLTDERVFFNKVPSQWESWKEQGGALISYKFYAETHPHEALLFVEAPKFMWMMRNAIAATKEVVVIYEPPTWKAHEEQIRLKYSTKPSRERRHLRDLESMKLFVQQLPELTAQRLETVIRRARQAGSRLSSAPALSGVGARLPDIHD